MTTIAELLEDYSWKNAFGYAIDEGSPVIGYEGSLKGFGPEDVREVIACDEGENDGPDWIALLKLKDGRYAFLSAGCDYTGWDCQAGGSTVIGDQLQHLIRFGVPEEARTRLKLKVS